jgi:RimJ/RimL family protein N-acetyltransferase
LRVPTRSQAARCLAGGAAFDFAEGYPSAFVVQLFRLLVEYPASLPAPGTLLGPWVAFLGADDTVVGAVSCAVVDDGPGGAQSASAVTVGYDVAPACEGRGYATEMLRLVCDHLLAQPGIERVCADTEAGHAASRRVMEKAGFTWRRDETDVRDGRTTTVAHYALDRAPAARRP